MTSYGYGDGTTYYQVTVRGELTDGPGAADWQDQEDEVYAAGRNAAPFTRGDVHIVYQANPNDEPAVARWATDAIATGPMPTWESDSTVPALMEFRLIVTPDMYLRSNPDNPLSVGADMHDVITAVLARATLGTDPVAMPIAAHAAMTFTPHTLEYTQNMWTPVRADIAAPLIGYTFDGLTASEYYTPTLWVVPHGATQGPMISACYDGAGNRWDEPGRPTPTFEQVPL